MHLEYKTSDIVLAAFLRLNGCQMSGIEKQGQKGTFVFANVPDTLVVDYDLGKASVYIVTGKQIGRASCRERVSSPV